MKMSFSWFNTRKKKFFYLKKKINFPKSMLLQIQKKSFKIKNLYLHFKFSAFMQADAKRPFNPGFFKTFLVFFNYISQKSRRKT